MEAQGTRQESGRARTCDVASLESERLSLEVLSCLLCSVHFGIAVVVASPEHLLGRLIHAPLATYGGNWGSAQRCLITE